MHQIPNIIKRRSEHARSSTRFEIYHGDCMDGMRTFLDETIDIVVTSPPYNLSIKYSSYKDDQKREAYLAWCLQWAEEIKRILKPNGSFFLNIGAAPSNPLLPFEITEAFTQENLFILQNSIHWIKAISMETEDGEVISKGHFKPINSERFLNDCHEHVFHFTKKGETRIDRLAIGVPYTDKTNIARWSHTGGRDKRCAGNTWFIPYETIRDRVTQRPHPASFPPELAERCILLHGIKSDTVMLDPFVGIGSAAVAAKKCDIPRFIGFDVDEKYLAVACERTGAQIAKLSSAVG
jgi:site-specific DNA-methyltransferase (adenine-specific)